MAEKDKIGKYKIIEKIGEGGMGKVYKAIHPTLRHPVIIKQLRITQEKSVMTQRFKREARIMIDFRNENIVQVYDHFKEGTSYYIAMEFIDGVSLEALIKSKKQICPMAALLILYETAKGLKYAHDKGVVHRDIKPDNVLISKTGRVKLVDFGIATAREENEEDLTHTGAVMGTPSYMSPEQLSNSKDVDKRSDIYSLGVMFYKMITGEKPFPSNFTAEAINSITKGKFEKPEKLNPSIPRLFRKIIKKTMNHKLKKRYKDLKFLIKLIQKYLSRLKEQRDINRAIHDYMGGKNPEIDLETMPIRKKKNPVLKFISIVAVLGILGAAGFILYSRGYFHEYLFGKTYGALEVRALIPKTYYKNPGYIYARAFLESDKEAANKKLLTYSYQLKQPFDFFFFPDKEIAKIGKTKTVLSTDRIYLPSGKYTLHLVVENNRIVETFYLNPRAIQKQETYFTYSRKLLEFSVAESARKTISVEHRIIDSETGKSIDSIAGVYLKTKIGWQDYKADKAALAETIQTGSKPTFRFEAPGYYPQVVTFTIEPNMEVLKCIAALVRIPGTLVLASDAEGLEIEIDGRKENYIGGEKKQFVSYGVTVLGNKEIPLKAGKYSITIKWENVFRPYQFKITEEKTTRLKVSYDKKNRIINIKEE